MSLISTGDLHLADHRASLTDLDFEEAPDPHANHVTLVVVLPMLFNAYLGMTLPIHPDDVYLGLAGTDLTCVPYLPPPIAP